MTRRGPTFFGIGPYRSGTTSLHRYLVEHPTIFVARKELHYFDRNFNIDPSRYEDFFDSSFEERGDITPAYMHEVDKIRGRYPHSRLIITIRDPIDRFISEINFYVKNFFISDWSGKTVSGSRMLEQEAAYLQRRFGSCTFQHIVDLFDVRKAIKKRGPMLEMGRYDVLIETVKRSGLEFLIVEFEQIANDQQRAWDSVCDFLKQPRHVCASIHENASPRPFAPDQTDLDLLKGYYYDTYDYLANRHGIVFSREPHS